MSSKVQSLSQNYQDIDSVLGSVSYEGLAFRIDSGSDGYGSVDVQHGVTYPDNHNSDERSLKVGAEYQRQQIFFSYSYHSR